MTTRALRTTTILGLGLLLAFTSSPAQDEAESHHSFGCSSTQAESTFSADLNHPSKLQLLPITDEKEIQQAQTGAFHTLYSKIDAEKYKISRTEFYVHQEKPKDPAQAPPYAPLTIYVKITSSEGTLWWKVVEVERERINESFLSAQSPNVDEEHPSPLATILPATGDRTIPIFDVQMSSTQQAQWTANVEAHLLLDLRLPQPKVAADLSCNSITAFGVCGVWDAQQQGKNNYECDWIADDNDFRCERTDWNSDSTKRQIKSWFQLLSGKDIPFAVPAGNPATLQQFAELAERDPSWRTRQIELPGVGKTSEILRLPGAHDRVVHVFAAYSDPAPFSSLFFYVILTKDSPPELGYIPSLSLFEDDPEDKIRNRELEFQRKVADQQKIPLPANQIDTGTSLSFGVKELLAAPLAHIYRITAREDGSRAVYWLAIDDQQSDGKTLFSMTRLASNVSNYAGCARYQTEASAAVITMLKGPRFRALIDVEPSHKTSENAEGGFEPPDTENGENAEDQCPYSIHLEWNHKEWHTDDPKTKCAATFSPRAITIADDGTITAKPGTVNKGE